MTDSNVEKITVDILMGVAIILEFLSLPIILHQFIGIGLVFLIILHIKFNKHYFKAIPKGKYNFKRAVDLIINIGLMMSLFITIISGILSSFKSFKHMTIRNHEIKHIHKYSSVVSLVFLVLHILTTHKKLVRKIMKIK